MIIVNGEIKGKLYNEQRVSVDQLCKLFDIELPKQDLVKLDLVDSRRKTDRFGQKNSPKGFLLLSNTTGVIDGSQVSIQYAKTSQKVKGEVVYTPRHVSFKGGVNAFDTSSADKEMLLLLMIHQKCEQSPFTEKKNKYYRIVDEKADAKQKLTAHVAMKQVYDLVFDENIGQDMLLNKAAGMGISINRRTIEQIQGDLIEKAQQDSIGFVNQFTDGSTTLDGLIIRAKDMGVIVSKREGTTTVYSIPQSQWFASPVELGYSNLGSTGGDAVIASALLNEKELIPKLTEAVAAKNLSANREAVTDDMFVAPAETPKEKPATAKK